MKHGRRHRRLKEQAYLERKDAEGYARPYDLLPVPPPKTDAGTEEAPAGTPLARSLERRTKNALRRLGLDPDKE